MHPASRSYFGTLNNYTVAELEQLKEHECRYMALGFHVGLKSKLPHVHIIIQYKNMRAMPRFNKRIHWQMRKGTLKQALDYLNKDGKLEERGDRPRLDNDISKTFKEHYDDAKRGEIHADSAMYVRYRSYLDHVAAANRPPYIYPNELHCKNLWIVGKTGCGKSRFVRETAIAENKSVFSKPMNKWWDGFCGQDYVLLDDISPEICKYLKDHLKIWLDRYDFNGEVKGSSIRIDPSYRMVITSQYTPQQCFNDTDLQAILRRMEVWNMDEVPSSPSGSQTWDDVLPSWH